MITRIVSRGIMSMHLTLQRKLIIVFSLYVLSLISIGFIGIKGFLNVNHSFEEIVNYTAPTLIDLGQIKAAFSRMLGEAIGAALINMEKRYINRDENGKDSQDTWEMNFVKLPESYQAEFLQEASHEEDKEEEEFEEAIKELERWVADYQRIEESKKYVKLLTAHRISEDAKNLEIMTKALLVLRKQGITSADIMKYKHQLEAAEEHFMKSVDAAIDSESSRLKQDHAEAKKTMQQTVFLYLGIVILFILSFAILGIATVQAVVEPIKNLTAAANNMSQGRLDVRVQVESSDEIGQLTRSFNQMVEKLNTSYQFLEETRKKAEVANLAKSTFLANMSHELRTPLNGILGYTQILSRDKTMTPKQQEGVHVIHRSGEYLLTLINDILDLSKIEAGKIALYPIDFNFLDFIANITELFTVRAQQKGINFIYKPLSQLPLGIRADEKRLRQIIINLLSNAVKFTEKGGVTFKINYHQEKMRFQVEDTGVGISEEDIGKILQPFQQLGNRDSKAEGTGLGLSITQKLVELMGGQLHIESTLGHGSTFCIELLLPEVSDLIKSEKDSLPVIIGFEGKARKLLVIDDKWTNRSVMVNLLTPLGFELIEAENGQDGLEKTIEKQPDLIITDLVMPVMDGFEVVRRIRHIPALQNIPIIAASASVFDFHQKESREAGCDDFLSKPFRAETLFDLLQRHLALTWIYDETNHSPLFSHAKTHDNESATPEETFVGPPVNQAKLLLNLSMMGDIAGVLSVLDELEKIDKKYLPFTRKVRHLAKNFEEEKICEIVQRFVD